MIFTIYCIKDRLTGFLTPTFDQNDPSAIRNFRHALLHTDSLLNSHPADFDLYSLGEFNSETGVIVSCDPRVVATGSSVVLPNQVKDGDFLAL